MRQEIIGGKVYFVENLSDLEKIQIKKVGKTIKKVGKKLKKVVKPVLVGTAVYFGTPILATKVIPSVGNAGKNLLTKIATTKTGAWWVKQGKKVYRVFKTPDQKVISQEIQEKNPYYNELVAKLPDGVVPNSFVKELSDKIPAPLPSGLSKTDVEKISTNLKVEPMSEEYTPDKVVEVKETGEVVEKKPVEIGTALPLVLGGIGLLQLI
jgi:hypothetical protein